MLDGTYSVKLKTPMGIKKGDIILKTNGNILDGKMIVMGKTNPFLSGTFNNDEFTFTGELGTMVGKISFECSGQVIGDEITGVVKTKKGNLELVGTRK